MKKEYSPDQQRTVTISVIGAPNAGKSTLINHLAANPVSITTPKRQTTRVQVRAIIMHEETQMIFIDTPGIFRGAKKLDKFMVNSAYDSISQADEVLLLLDATHDICEDFKMIVSSLKKHDKVSLVINKTDCIKPRSDLIPIAQAANAMFDFQQVFMISAKKSTGITPLLNHITKISRQEPWAYPEDQLSDVPLNFVMSEFTRRRIFLNLQEELPYSMHVQTESWEEQTQEVTIRQKILAISEAHKKIIIGKGGHQIKKIGTEARIEMEKFLNKKVHLFLMVEVCPKWQEDVVNSDQMYS